MGRCYFNLFTQRIMEIAAAIFSLLSAFLAMKKNFHNWTIGILGIVFYSVIFWENHLYADFTLQMIFLFQSFQGIIGWTRTQEKSLIKWHTLLYTFVSLVIVSYFFLSKFTNDPNPLLDSVASGLSLMATYLMIKKNIKCWYFWVAADIVYIFLFYSRGLYVSLGLYCIFTLIAINGYFEWKKLATDEKLV